LRFSGIVFNPGLAGERSEGNVVSRNLIGADANGQQRMGNAVDGITFFGARGNSILDNVVVANGFNGISLVQTFDGNGSVENEVRGNFIGTTAEGSFGLGNVVDGVAVFNGQNNTIGGTSTEHRNIISSN